MTSSFILLFFVEKAFEADVSEKQKLIYDWISFLKKKRKNPDSYCFLIEHVHVTFHKVHIFWEATKFCKIFTLLLPYVVPVKSKVKISQNFAAFSEYINFSWNGGSSVRKEKNPLDYLVCIVYFIKVGDKIKDFY